MDIINGSPQVRNCIRDDLDLTSGTHRIEMGRLRKERRTVLNNFPLFRISAESVTSLSVGVQCTPEDDELRASSETCLASNSGNPAAAASRYPLQEYPVSTRQESGSLVRRLPRVHASNPGRGDRNGSSCLQQGGFGSGRRTTSVP